VYRVAAAEEADWRVKVLAWLSDWVRPFEMRTALPGNAKLGGGGECEGDGVRDGDEEPSCNVFTANVSSS
jgi:hypothetical protein